MKKIFIFLLSSILCFSSSFAATSVTDNTITWTFDGDYTVGQFVNGDYWVLGPVTITAVDPAWSGTMNGAMVDPVPLAAQGFDTRASYTFLSANRQTFPCTLTAPAGDVISLISVRSGTKAVGGAAEVITDAAVLTVVAETPAANSFRPAYIDQTTAKTFYTTAQVDYNAVPTLALPAGASLPNLTQMANVWLDFGPKVSGATIHPRNQMPPYPRDSCKHMSDVALACLVDSPDRNTYINQMIQLGIDLYAIQERNSDGFRAYGGFGSGRKWPILFAGIVLNNAAMQAPRAYIWTGSTINKFGEDGHTYYGQPTVEYPSGKPLWGWDCDAVGYTYPYFGNHDCRDQNGLLEPHQMPNGGGYMFCCTSHVWVGEALAARLCSAQDMWNWNAFFDFVDRWVAWSPQSSDTANYGSLFVKAMWDDYRLLDATPTPTASNTPTITPTPTYTPTPTNTPLEQPTPTPTRKPRKRHFSGGFNN